jgi:hypothetical protein
MKDTHPGETTLLERRAELRRDILLFTSRASSATRPWAETEAAAEFDALAERVIAHQRDALPAYGALVEACGAAGAGWRTAPLVPAELFAEMDLCSLPEASGDRVFETSGTTSKGARPGRRRVPDLELYEAGMAGPFVRHVLAGLAAPVRWLSLIPPAEIMPRSSLSFMVTGLAEALARETVWAFDTGGLDLATAQDALSEGPGLGDEPMVVLTTAFALAELLEKMERRVRLPTGSRLMVTGGFKGKRRALEEAELHAAVKRQLGLGADAIIDEYGMTELSSQAWGRPLSPNPTLRLRIVDPETGAPCEIGKKGLVGCFDLLNLDNVSAVLTSDIGAVNEDGGLRLFGRLPGAVPRGCSLSAEEIAARTAGR